MYVQQNREIKKSIYTVIETIDLALIKLIDDYGVKIQYHDVSGIFLNDYKLGPILMKYYSHNNEFCRYIKTNEKCCNECYKLKNVIYKHITKRKKPFYGRCHMGMEEYIFPVISNDHYIGYFTIGEFYTDKEKTEFILKKYAEKWGFDENTIIEKYFKTAKKIDFDPQRLSVDINLIINLIALYIKYNVKQNEHIVENEIDTGNKNFIVDKIKEYVMENYSDDITLETLAEKCHCNSSYISHLFKKKTGVSITEYINDFRINKAKYLLYVSDMTITQISYEVGYNDSGYFSRVFKKKTGMSPEKFRKNSKQ